MRQDINGRYSFSPKSISNGSWLSIQCKQMKQAVSDIRTPDASCGKTGESLKLELESESARIMSQGIEESGGLGRCAVGHSSARAAEAPSTIMWLQLPAFTTSLFCCHCARFTSTPLHPPRGIPVSSSYTDPACRVADNNGHERYPSAVRRSSASSRQPTLSLSLWYVFPMQRLLCSFRLLSMQLD